jgi:hypothetical protein
MIGGSTAEDIRTHQVKRFTVLCANTYSINYKKVKSGAENPQLLPNTIFARQQTLYSNRFFRLILFYKTHNPQQR